MSKPANKTGKSRPTPLGARGWVVLTGLAAGVAVPVIMVAQGGGSPAAVMAPVTIVNKVVYNGSGSEDAPPPASKPPKTAKAPASPEIVKLAPMSWEPLVKGTAAKVCVGRWSEYQTGSSWVFDIKGVTEVKTKSGNDAALIRNQFSIAAGLGDTFSVKVDGKWYAVEVADMAKPVLTKLPAPGPDPMWPTLPKHDSVTLRVTDR